MIDTVILSIPKEKATMLDMSAYGVSGWDLQAKTKAYEKFTKNPSSKDKEYGYFPRLTGYRRKNGRIQWDSTIRIEFSAPKLIYQNNLDELIDGQFEQVVEELYDRMSRMGVVIPQQYIKEATVTSVHYSKNVELKNMYTSQYVISELNKINLNKRFDLTRARFMNDGQSLYAYTQSHSFVIYDKVADLVRGKKRSIDREQTVQQLKLFGPLTEGPDSHEILRFEVRLSQKRKMKSLFKKLGFDENPTFGQVFSKEKSKAVLQYYWNTMISGNSMTLFGYSPTSKDLLKQILLTKNKMGPKEAIYKAGLICLIREGNGMRELRTILSKQSKDRTWYRIASDAKETGLALNKLRPREWYEQVEKAFKEFKAYRIPTQKPGKT